MLFDSNTFFIRTFYSKIYLLIITNNTVSQYRPHPELSCSCVFGRELRSSPPQRDQRAPCRCPRPLRPIRTFWGRVAASARPIIASRFNATCQARQPHVFPCVYTAVVRGRSENVLRTNTGRHSEDS